MKPKRVAVYIRVSTGDQNADLQRNELTDYSKFRKWEIVETYPDVMSGAKDKRPALDRLMADARRGKFDVVVVWRFDRFARSTSHLLRALEEFQSLSVDFVSLTESIHTSTPTGKMVFTVLAAVAELERSTIRERVLAGQKAARRRGVRFGRPTVKGDTDHALKLRRQGLSWRDISAEVGEPKDTLIRHCEAQRFWGVFYCDECRYGKGVTPVHLMAEIKCLDERQAQRQIEKFIDQARSKAEASTTNARETAAVAKASS